MPSRIQRITNGHRAAVCALSIVGVPFRDACYIVGAPSKEVRAYMPEEWFGRPASHTLDDTAWRRVRAAYEAGVEPVDDIAKRYRIGNATIYVRARRCGWEMRGGGARRNPLSIRSMPPDRRRMYRKLRYQNGLSYDQAVAGAWA